MSLAFQDILRLWTDFQPRSAWGLDWLEGGFVLLVLLALV